MRWQAWIVKHHDLPFLIKFDIAIVLRYGIFYMHKINERQRKKLNSTLAAIGQILESKVVNSNSKPVFLKISMNQGGFRSLEEFSRESISKTSL